MNMRGVLVLLTTLGLFAPGARVGAGVIHFTDRAAFQALYQGWTDAFNRKDLKGASALFARDVVADYRGVPHKNYDSITGSFKKTFARTDRVYKYSFKLHDIYRSGDLAAVRVTWYLTVAAPGKPESATTTWDEGLDVLRRGADGRWQIVNYLGYEAG